LTSRAGRVALWSIGLAAGAGVLVLALTDASAAHHRVPAAMTVLVGWSLMVSGLIAWRRRPGNRLGPLMVALGLAWLLGLLIGHLGVPLLFTAGLWAGDAFVIWLMIFLTGFPDGRLSRSDWLLVAPFALALVPLELAWLLFFDAGPPGNVLLTWNDPGVADAIDTAQRVILAIASFVATAVFALRWRRASPPVRRGLTAILAGAATLLVSTGNNVVSKLTGHPPSDPLQIVVLATLIAVPLAVSADMLRARLARSGVGELVLALRARPASADLRAALARALGDPSLRLAYWLPEYDTYADLDGRPVALPADPAHATKVVDGTGRPVAALLHDPSLHDEPALLDAVGAAAGIALENARLHAELQARLDELRGTRARILDASQSERRRLERDLHDGAQQRLVALSLELGLLEARLGGDPDARRSLSQARSEVSRSLDELRALARGIHPAIVTGHGLAVALEGLAARAPVPVHLDVQIGPDVPESIEVAAYFLVAESLTNVAKYAHASGASVAVTRANGDLVVEVADDGVGGACAQAGSGLRGLADRVEALGGRLVVTSVDGAGTRVHAEIPCG
jgi:signal transduction histidine kinase